MLPGNWNPQATWLPQETPVHVPLLWTLLLISMLALLSLPRCSLWVSSVANIKGLRDRINRFSPSSPLWMWMAQLQPPLLRRRRFPFIQGRPFLAQSIRPLTLFSEQAQEDSQIPANAALTQFADRLINLSLISSNLRHHLLNTPSLLSLTIQCI